MDSDEPLLIDTGRGFTVKYKNRYLYSSVDPVRSIEERIRSLEFGDETLVFVPSLGLGYGLRDLLARLPGSCHILCVEVDQRLMALALKRNPVPLPLSPRLTVVRSESDEQIVSVLHSLGVDRFRRVLTVRLSGGYYLNRGTYDSFARCLEEEVHTFWKNKMTLFHMGELWIRNILQNLDQIRRSSDITSLGTALPVLVTGAGPSLEENLGLIRKIRERVVVLTVDTALSVLEGGGIKPDIILALEAQIANLQDFIGHTSSGVPLLCDISCSPSVVRLFAESSFFFSSSFYPLELFSRMKAAGLLPEPIPPLGSVGVAAV
ncbi:MAG TPA: 6-hydroxymethylpterin diphosphokinase MptE-like protein, partial [Spirochaetia bacterium]|nr:6-hydroxymethylpterin diphosphokinase MptE-like protein [Spirochaetia bacterium]